MTTTITEYSATDGALAELRTKYEAVVYDVTNGKGMEQAKKARAELREHRVSLEKERVRIKAPALERCRQIDSEAKRITAELEALEQPIDGQIKQEEQRKEIEKAAREQAERERVAALNARFDAIKALPLRAVGASADEIRAVIAEAEAIDHTTFPDENFQAAALFEKRMAIGALRAALDKQILADEEAEKIKADRAELERLRAEQVEAQRVAAEHAAAVQASVERNAREQREAQAAAAKIEQDRIDAERAEAIRIEDEQRAAAAQKLREEQQAAAAERARLDAEKKAAARREREQAIANASLLSAATDAVALLQAEGYGDYIETQKLEAAINREPAQLKEVA
jgi:Protein of unknown function (DUF1351).